MMSRRGLVTLAAGVWAVALSTTGARAQELPPELADFLRTEVGLRSAQVSAVQHGEALAKVLDTDLPRDIALFGIAAVALSREDYVRDVVDVADAASRPTRRNVGIFSTPATLDDVKDVSIGERDVHELKTCRPGACVMKLPATAMARLHDEIDWWDGDAQTHVSALARQALVDYVSDYRARGDAALVVYDDRGAVRASEAFADLLAATQGAYQYTPALERYLTGYPKVVLPPAAEVLFWSEDEVPRLRPILSLTHLVVYLPPDRPELTLTAAKQIYADHYFEAAFDLMCLVEDVGHGGYLVVLRRFRFDQLSSGGPFDLRGRVVEALRRQLLVELRHYQDE